MELNIDGITLNYQRHFGNGPAVLLLHGWGVSGDTFKSTFDFLSSIGINVLTIDFPGFGKSGSPYPNWGIYDYAEIINKFIAELSLEKVILVGHSFGGRVAIILASKYAYVEKIVLVSSAGLKPRFSLKKKIDIYKFKIRRFFGKDVSSYGSEDYKALDPLMKKIFVRVVNTYLNKHLKNISCPTLIVWGELDTQTPLYMAKKLNKGIKNSELKIMYGTGHFGFFERPEQFNIILDSFIRS